MTNIYISGTSSGLGKFLIKSISNSKKFFRNKNNNIKKNSILVHSAFFKKTHKKESKKQIELNTKYTLNLFKKIKAHKFNSIVFISSIDVSDKSSKNSYVLLKRKLENELKKTKNFYIFRCGNFIGKYMRRNSIYKLIKSKSKTKITLSKKSSIYLTSYNDLLDGIKKIIKQKKIKNGIYNAISKNKLYFKNFENKNIIFGNYNLNYKKISNLKFEKNFKIKTKTINKLVKEINKI